MTSDRVCTKGCVALTGFCDCDLSASAARPDTEDERRALGWLVDVRTHGGPLERRFATTVIETLAWFEEREERYDVVRHAYAMEAQARGIAEQERDEWAAIAGRDIRVALDRAEAAERERDDAARQLAHRLDEEAFDDHERWAFHICPDCGGYQVDAGPGEPHPAWPGCSC